MSSPDLTVDDLTADNVLEFTVDNVPGLTEEAHVELDEAVLKLWTYKREAFAAPQLPGTKRKMTDLLSILRSQEYEGVKYLRDAKRNELTSFVAKHAQAVSELVGICYDLKPMSFKPLRCLYFLQKPPPQSSNPSSDEDTSEEDGELEDDGEETNKENRDGLSDHQSLQRQ